MGLFSQNFQLLYTRSKDIIKLTKSFIFESTEDESLGTKRIYHNKGLLNN